MKKFAALIKKSNDYINFQFSGMKKSLLLLFLALNSVCTVNAIVYYSQATGTFNTLSNWNSNRLGGGTTPGNFSTSGDIFIVQGAIASGGGGAANHTMTITGASVTFGAGVRLQIEGGGNVISSNSLAMNATSTFQIDANGTYTHSNTGTWASLLAGVESFAATSNFIINSSATTGFGTPTTGFGNLTYAATANTNSSGNLNDAASSTGKAIQGNFTVSGTSYRITGNTGVTGFTIGGDLIINTGGTFTLGNGSAGGTGGGALVINIGGNFNMSGGTLDYIATGGTAPYTATVNFIKAGTATFTKTGGTITALSSSSRNITINVTSGCTLDMGTSILDALATTNINFNLNAGGGLITRNTGGIASGLAASGCIQNLGGTRTFSTGADYTYNGTAAQVMGTGFTGARNLTINNTSGATPAVTFIVNATISGNLTVTAGDVRNTSGTGRTITMTGAAAILTVGGSITGTNVGAGNDINLTYTNTGGTLLITGGGSLCRFLNVTNTNSGSFIALARTLEIMFGTFTESGFLQINSGGAISTAVNAVAPTYGAASTLVYSSGTSYGVSGEWTGTGVTPGLGIPRDIIVQNNTTVTTSAARGLAGGLLVTSGSTFVAGGGTLAATGGALINGAFQLNSGGFATGTFTYAATGSSLIFNTPYTVAGAHAYFPSSNGPANVTVNSGTSTVDFGSVTRTITGIFSVAATISNYCNLTFNGSVALNSGYNFSDSCGAGLPAYACNSTLNYNSGGTPSRGSEWGSGTTPGSISITNNTTFNGNSGTASVCGNLTIAAGSSLYMDFGSSGASALNVAGNVSIAGNLSLGFGVGGDMTVGGNWTRTGGSFNTNNRLVTFNGASGNQTVTNAAGETFAFLTVNKASGNVVLGGNVTVSNTLALTNGNLSIAANTLTLNSAFSRTNGFLAGGNTSNLTIGGTAGSLHFDNTGTNNFLKGFTINTGASATLANDLNITSYDGIGAEGVLTVAGTGVLNTGGFLAIKSNVNGTARIAANTSGGTYINGHVSVERFIPQNSSKDWRLLASNTTGQTINAAWQEGQADAASNTSPGFGTQISSGNALGNTLSAAQTAGFDALSTGVSLFKYNPATDGLEPVSNTASTGLASQPGYFIFIRGDRSGGGSYGGGAPTTSTVLRSKGSVFQGSQTTTTGAQNYALARNPYASRIDMRNITVQSNVSDAFQVWDSKLGGSFGVGAYQTFVRSGPDYIVVPGGGSYGAINSVQNFIESGAAFFIQSVSNVSNNSIIIPETAKATASSNASFRPATPAAGESRLSFSLYANNTGGSVDLVDGGLAYFSNEYNNAVDVQDVRKNLNFNENFGMKRANTDLVIERKQPIDQNDTIFFHMTSLRSISYRLDVEATNMDPLITTAILKDKYTNTNTTLDLATVNAYTFTVDANAASRAADRFSIVFRQSGVVPVSFVSVKAAQAGNNIAVEWKVANEVNTVRYEVEKSTDGRSFSKKGTVLATGADTYNWLDENTVNGFNYYRIRSVDNNGQVKYTQVVKVQLGGKAGISISPNPVQGNFVNILINQPLAGKYGIRLTNIAGQAVYNREVTHNGGSVSQSFVLPSALSSGIYQLEVIAPDNTRQVEKLIIQGN